MSVISTSKYLAAALYLHTRLHRASECLCAQTAPWRHIYVRHSTAYYPGLRVTGAGRGMKGAQKGDGKFDKKRGNEMKIGWADAEMLSVKEEEESTVTVNAAWKSDWGQEVCFVKFTICESASLSNSLTLGFTHPSVSSTHYLASDLLGN